MKKNSEWKGYTFDEMRMQRILASTRLDLEKMRLAEQFQHKESVNLVGGPIVKKLLGSLNYIDYAVLAFRLGKNVFKFFRHH